MGTSRVRVKQMKAKVVDKKELKKSPVERQAESLLRRLSPATAIEVELDSTSSRTIRRVFSKAASNLGLSINLKTKEDRIYVLLKENKSPKKNGLKRDALDKTTQR